MFDAKLNFTKISEIFFNDYELNPLFVQENYLEGHSFNAKNTSINDLKSLYETTESICKADTIKKKMVESQNYALLYNYGFLSCSVPVYKSKKNVGFAKFPELLGKTSNLNKKKRLNKSVKCEIKLIKMGHLYEGTIDLIIKEFCNYA